MKKFFAGIIDRIIISIMFFIITMICFGPYLSSEYIGGYSVVAVETHPSNYEYMPSLSHGSTSSHVSDSYRRLQSLDQAERGVNTYYELDTYMTAIFILANILYLFLSGALFKSTIGERLCKLKTVDNDGEVLDAVGFIKKSLILGVVLYVLVQIRDLVDTTYLATSILFLVINWGLIVSKKKSLVDLLSKSNVIGKNDIYESNTIGNSEANIKSQNKKYIILGIVFIVGLIAFIAHIQSNKEYDNSYNNTDQKLEVKQAEVEKWVEQSASHDDNEAYDVVEEMPSFPGGTNALIQYLSSNIKYPEVAEENGVQGRVICSFIVEEDGHISDVRVDKSVEPSLDREAVRVIQSMPNWEPGKQNGSAVRVKYLLPVTFRLE